MARRFAEVFEEEIEEAFFYRSDLGNTKILSGDSCILHLRLTLYGNEYGKCRSA